MCHCIIIIHVVLSQIVLQNIVLVEQNRGRRKKTKQNIPSFVSPFSASIASAFMRFGGKTIQMIVMAMIRKEKMKNEEDEEKDVEK